MPSHNNDTNSLKSKEESLLDLMRLVLVDRIGPALVKKMVSYLGGATSAFKANRKIFTAVDGLGEAHYRMLHAKDTTTLAKAVLQESKDVGLHVLSYLDVSYPHRLRNCMDSPAILFYDGTLEALTQPRTVSIVGTRNSTRYGEEFTDRFVGELVKRGVVVNSGLAYGIDAAAHKAALRHGGKTVGVVAHGLDRISPVLHRELAENMKAEGGILSEHRIGVRVQKGHFPMRNRIVAGMSDAVIVIESDKRGGSLITAMIANDYNRDVFALPGRIDDQYSRGCNALIQKNQAHILNDIDEFMAMMGWQEEVQKKDVQMPLFVEMDDKERSLFALLGRDPKTVDVICAEAGMSMSQVSITLLKLEFKGLVRTLPGKQYVTINY